MFWWDGGACIPECFVCFVLVLFLSICWNSFLKIILVFWFLQYLSLSSIQFNELSLLKHKHVFSADFFMCLEVGYLRGFLEYFVSYSLIFHGSQSFPINLFKWLRKCKWVFQFLAKCPPCLQHSFDGVAGKTSSRIVAPEGLLYVYLFLSRYL